MMSTFFSYILWNADPVIVEVFGRALRWYGLLFGLGLYFGLLISYRMMRTALLPASVTLDRLFLPIFVGTIVGARLGHILFYDPAFYFSNPLEILYIHKGGLASHGGVFGVFLALWFFARRHKVALLALLDYAVIAMPLAFFFIRMANLANSEIYGLPTEAPHGFVFTRTATERLQRAFEAEKISYSPAACPVARKDLAQDLVQEIVLEVDVQHANTVSEDVLRAQVRRYLPRILSARAVRDHITYPAHTPPLTIYEKEGKQHVSFCVLATARHPTQLYEGVGYLLLFVFFYTVRRRRGRFFSEDGVALGLGLMYTALVRFVVEYWKIPQEEFSHALPLNMGQMLSLPFFLAGAYLLFWRLKRPI